MRQARPTAPIQNTAAKELKDTAVFQQFVFCK